jgi:hypothetical protein
MDVSTVFWIGITAFVLIWAFVRWDRRRVIKKLERDGCALKKSVDEWEARRGNS